MVDDDDRVVVSVLIDEGVRRVQNEQAKKNPEQYEGITQLNE